MTPSLSGQHLDAGPRPVPSAPMPTPSLEGALAVQRVLTAAETSAADRSTWTEIPS